MCCMPSDLPQSLDEVLSLSVSQARAVTGRCPSSCKLCDAVRMHFCVSEQTLIATSMQARGVALLSDWMHTSVCTCAAAAYAPSDVAAPAAAGCALCAVAVTNCVCCTWQCADSADCGIAAAAVPASDGCIILRRRQPGALQNCRGTASISSV